MLHHLSLPVEDLARSRALYSAALGALGYRQVSEETGFAGFGLTGGEDMFALKQVASPRAAGEGFHIAFSAPSKLAVDAFHRTAVAHGATVNGSPAIRAHYGPDYYAAFVIDLDGHRLEAVHLPPRPRRADQTGSGAPRPDR